MTPVRVTEAKGCSPCFRLSSVQALLNPGRAGGASCSNVEAVVDSGHSSRLDQVNSYPG